MKKKARWKEIDDQLHAIWSISMYILATDCQLCGERFCFVLNNARSLLPLETAFFETARAGKGFYRLIIQFPV
jgi:hypothetical protein